MKSKEIKCLNIRIEYRDAVDMKDALRKIKSNIDNESVCGEFEIYKMKATYVIEKVFSDDCLKDEIKGKMKNINGKMCLTFMSRL